MHSSVLVQHQDAKKPGKSSKATWSSVTEGSAADCKLCTFWLLCTFFSASFCRPAVLDGGTLAQGWKAALGEAQLMEGHLDSLA